MKKSKGVIFWAFFFIVCALVDIAGNAFGLIKAISLKTSIDFDFYATYLILIMNLAILISAILILRQNDRARILLLLMMVMNILFFQPYHLYGKYVSIKSQHDVYYQKGQQSILDEVKPEYREKQLEFLKESRDRSMNRSLITFISGSIFVILLKGAPIYFFTRPKVREQFK